jgi:alkaline phosphatase
MNLKQSKYLLWGVIILIFIIFPLIFRMFGTKGNKGEETVAEVVDQESQKSTFVTKSKPKKVIFLIGDGMGLSQISAGSIAKRDGLALEKFRHIGLIKTYSTKLITDSAAGATAMATGHKTYNGAISMNLQQDSLKTILEYAEEAGWLTGIITTATVTHATPACFYGHQPTRAKVNRKLAAQFMQKDIELLMGGGWAYFKQGLNGRDHIEEAKEKGYFVIDDINKLGDYTPKKLLCLISEELPPRLNKRGDFLPKATKKGIDVLNYNNDPFFLMIEGAQIDWGGHNKDSDYIIEEMLDFDKAVEAALDFAEKDGNTLVLVTADHETGGYSINAGDHETGKVEGAFTSTYHTATMVPVFAYGPGAESFEGIYDNTEIFLKLKYLMGFSEN